MSRRKVELILLLAGALLAIVLLASSLSSLPLDPGQVRGGARPRSPGSLGILSPELRISPEIWRALRIAVIIMTPIALVYVLLSPELRRQAIRRALMMAAIGLLIYLWFRSRSLNPPEGRLEMPEVGPPGFGEMAAGDVADIEPLEGLGDPAAVLRPEPPTRPEARVAAEVDDLPHLRGRVPVRVALAEPVVLGDVDRMVLERQRRRLVPVRRDDAERHQVVLLLGLRHATDADHVIAVATIVGREKRIGQKDRRDQEGENLPVDGPGNVKRGYRLPRMVQR